MDYRRDAVLVVDDEVENLDAFTLNFGRKFQLRTANGGAEALEIARQENIAVVVADQRMPLMSGTQFLAEFKKIRPLAVRMILTGYTDLESVISAINQGEIHRYITKPWEARDIETILRNAIDHYRRDVERRRRLKELDTYNRVLKLIATDRSLSRVVKEVLETTAMDFGFARVFLLLGDPASDHPMRGQAVLREKGGRPGIQRVTAPVKGANAPLSQVVAASNGFSAERFVFHATTPAPTAPGKPEKTPAEVEFVCGPFYGAPLVVDGRVVGVLCADRAAGGRDRTDREDARFISTLATQIAVATGRHLTAENLQRLGGGEPRESSKPSRDPTRAAKRVAPALIKPDHKTVPVLVVDDDQSTLDLFTLNFGNAFRVLTARTSGEAVRLLETQHVGVIVTDQRLASPDEDKSPHAGLSGIELLAEAQDRDPDCVRMVLTGYSDIDEIIGAVNRGLVYRYVNKPWDQRELASLLREAIDFHFEQGDSRRLLREAEVMNRLMTVVAGESDPDRVADHALAVAVQELGYDRAFFFRYDEPTGNLVRGRSAARAGAPPAVERLRIPVISGGGLLARVVLEGGALISAEGPHQPGGVEVPSADRKATLAVPVGARPLGVLAVETAKGSNMELGVSDERTVSTIAEALAVAFLHAERLAELKDLESGKAPA
ncbi:MAG TPA: response regulator [bacterium]|nr:response regulator [bacterium]